MVPTNNNVRKPNAAAPSVHKTMDKNRTFNRSAKILLTTALVGALGVTAFAVVETPNTPTATVADEASEGAVRTELQSLHLTSRGAERAPLATALSEEVKDAEEVGETFALTEMEIEKIPFTTKTVEDPELEIGKTKVTQKGQDGEKRHIYTVQTDNEPHTRTVLYTVNVADPVTEITAKGTKPKPEPRPEPKPKPAPAATQNTPTPKVNDNPTGNRAIGKEMAAARGWGNDQYACLDKLWTRESNWRTTAKNPSSGAYGIPQSYPGSKLATAGSDWRTNPRTQITWGLNYIKGRYGTPCSAWGHSQQKGWY